MDVAPKGVTKASGPGAVRKRLGVTVAATIAVGDGATTSTCCAGPGRAWRMGHADEVRRSAADAVTGTVDDDGVVEVLRSLLSPAKDPRGETRVKVSIRAKVWITGRMPVHLGAIRRRVTALTVPWGYVMILDDQSVSMRVRNDAPHLVALDIDGTLLVTGQPVPGPTVLAVRLVRERKHHVVLASGRSLTGILPWPRSWGSPTAGWSPPTAR